MAWQCRLDGSSNVGDVCRACGEPPFTCSPVLTSDSLVIRVSSRQQLIGADNWSCDTKPRGISRFHARVFFDTAKARWNVANISSGSRLAINGVNVPPGQRASLDDGDILIFAGRISFRVTLQKASERREVGGHIE
jgi:FHA domain